MSVLGVSGGVGELDRPTGMEKVVHGKAKTTHSVEHELMTERRKMAVKAGGYFGKRRG